MLNQQPAQTRQKDSYFPLCGPSSDQDISQGIAVLGIKLSHNSMEQNRPNLSNRRQLTSNNKSIDKTVNKTSIIRGIKVMSSRQGSQERKGICTSRSKERGGEEKDNKSQTQVSQFGQGSQNERNQTNSGRSEEDNEMKKLFNDICRRYQVKIQQAITKNNSAHEKQLLYLRQTIACNQSRIANLIQSLNVILEKNQKKQKTIERLQQRLKGLQSYQKQCNQYALSRCQHVQTIGRVVIEEMEKDGGMKAVQRKEKIVNALLGSVLSKNKKKGDQYSEKELKNIKTAIDKMDEQIEYLSRMNEARQNFKEKEKDLTQYVLSMKNTLTTQKQSLCQHQLGKSHHAVQTQKVSQLSDQIQKLYKAIAVLEQQRLQIDQQYLKKEQKAQESIWQLSNLLNKKERDLEKRKKQIEEANKYNLQIQNKLIESKLKENSLRVEMESFCKGLQTSKNNQFDQLEKQKQCYKQKFEQSFRHTQYLQEMNCKNKIMIIQLEQDVERLTQKLDLYERQIYEYDQLKNQIKIKEEYWQNKLKLQSLALESTMKKIKEDNEKQQDIINENAKQILCLQVELKKAEERKNCMQTQYTKKCQEVKYLKRQFEDEQAYSEHLQTENEQLTVSLDEYKKIFQNQSDKFKSTIDQLKKQNTQLHKNMEAQAEKVFENQPKKYQSHRFTFNMQPPKTSRTSSSHDKSVSEKVDRLKQVLKQSGLQLPVLCQIDNSGYLKYMENGTYVYDSDDNPIELSLEEKQKAVNSKVIQLFQ